MRHLVSISDLSKEEIVYLLDLADKLKEERKKGIFKEYLKSRSLAMIFELPSTRTRVSFEVAMCEAGGNALYLNWNDLQLGRGEAIRDTAKVLSRYVHAVMMRVRNHETVVEFATHSEIPVINGLSNLEHPCQILADLQTIRERKGLDAVVAWVGDGNNVCNSLILAASILGFELRVATPEGYEPDRQIVEKALACNPEIRLMHDPVEAVKEADVIYTDVWASMGQESEWEERVKVFKPYQVNSRLLSHADEDAIVMHCLPAHRGEEITDEVMDGEHSAILDQAENRLHSQKALLIWLLGVEI